LLVLTLVLGDGDSVGSATAKSGRKCHSGYKPVLGHVKKSDSYSVGCAKKA
jgi:hypothetical protein